MQNAPFSGASLTDFLHQLADGVAGGCLHVGSGAQASKIFFRGGQVYATWVPGPAPDIGTRLITAGVLSPGLLAEVTESRRTTFPAWSVVDLLVHHGHVEQSLVDAIVREQICQSLSALLGWAPTAWRFRVNERTRDNVAPAMTVVDLLADLGRRQVAWQTIEAVIGSSAAVPFASPGAATPDELGLHPGARTLLGHVNGARTVTELAELCAFTEFETGQVVFALVQAQLLTISRHVSALPLVEPSPGAGLAADSGPLTRAFHALTTLLGPAPTGEDLFAVPVRTKRSATVGAAKRRAEALAAGALAAEVLAEQGRLEELERLKTAAELLAAQLAADELSAQLAADEAAMQVAEADRLAAEQAEAARLAAEQAEVARVAEAARSAAEAAEEMRGAQRALEQAEAERQAIDRATEQAADLAAAQAAKAASVAAHAVADALAAEQVDPDLHAAAFAELRAAAATTPAIIDTSSTVDPATTAPPTAPTPGPEPATTEPYRSRETDTASLLRELSSLGLDEDAEPESRPTAPARSVPRATAEDKKRKGRFGRG